METKKYIIAPHGDVIIRLRNFDAPIAVLQKDEELYVPNTITSFFGTKPLFGSAATFGSTSAFGSGRAFGPTGGFGSTTASGSTSLFGSAGTSGSTGGFGSTTASSSTRPLGSGGLFGSASTSGSTGRFGSTTASGSTSLFGSASTSGSTGGFGSTTASGSPSLFGSTGASGASGSTGGFGSTTTSTSTRPFGSSSLFGSVSASGSAGTSGSTGGFGSSRAFGSTGPSGSTPAVGSTSVFGSSSSAPFGSAIPSSSTSLFSKPAFGSTASSGSTSVFGTPASTSTSTLGSPTPSSSTIPPGTTSTPNSTGTASSSADTIKNPSQSPRNDVERESSRSAPQGSSETGVKSEEPAEPSSETPEIHFQVSSAHLKLASRYFQKAFDGEFQESQPDSDGFRHVDASDWDTEALLIVLRIIHGQNRKIPREIDLEILTKIAIVVDYYDCHEICDAFAELWLQRLKGRFILLNKIDRELLLLILVSWVFGWANEFKLATKVVLRQGKGVLNKLDLPIPESVIEALNIRRLEALRKIGFALDSLTLRLRVEPSPCTFECASMNLGALSKQMLSKKEINNAASVVVCLDGQSVVSTMDAARTIRSPNWVCHMRRGLLCDLHVSVNKEIDRLEEVDGLNLEDFARAAQDRDS